MIFFHFAFAVLLVLNGIFYPAEKGFRAEQLKYPRVREAIMEKESILSKLYADKNVSLKSANIFIRIFKEENDLELWAKNKEDKSYVLIKTFKICAQSGTLGPKVIAGDRQVPEGLYFINRFNPNSSYFL